MPSPDPTIDIHVLTDHILELVTVTFQGKGDLGEGIKVGNLLILK